MPDFLSYEPTTGVKKLFDMAEETIYIRSVQDVEPLLDRNREARNTRFYEGQREFTLYCSIPPIVQIELKQMGIDIYSKDPTMIKKMFQTINSKYPYLKVTDKKHE